MHPYTRTLIASIPGGEKVAPVSISLSAAATELPSPLNPPSGCRFRTRCPLATEQCAAEEPQLRRVGDGHYIACHNVAT
ncbi:oligopeptide/dipeptide ABC transporter ATP-binding protein [Nocardioides sp. B-3]|uniref:oligopeptide/dipeptide ABC transporter ATP-binding protein n=1 Tax=Nocardioides sp. B-3 TaxID=2895565 RepID=UPI003FA599A3